MWETEHHNMTQEMITLQCKYVDVQQRIWKENKVWEKQEWAVTKEKKFKRHQSEIKCVNLGSASWFKENKTLMRQVRSFE